MERGVAGWRACPASAAARLVAAWTHTSTPTVFEGEDTLERLCQETKKCRKASMKVETHLNFDKENLTYVQQTWNDVTTGALVHFFFSYK